MRCSIGPLAPMLFPEVRMVFVDAEGEFYHPLIGDMIEKKIPGSEYFAPLIHATYKIYQDLVQLENLEGWGKITEINANEHLYDPPMDLIWCLDKPHGSAAPDMFTASLVYAT